MEKLANKLAEDIASALQYDKEKEAVVAYGLVAIIQVSVTILLIWGLGFLTGIPAEALTVCFSASLLRKYSGGAHARTAELCSLLSIIYCLSAGMAAQSLSTIAGSRELFIGMLAALFPWSAFIVYRKAPVDSPNKPVRTEKKRKKMKLYSMLTLLAYFLLSLSALFFLPAYPPLGPLGFSLLLGTAWQTFTLTPYGFQFIGMINSISKISGSERRSSNE